MSERRPAETKGKKSKVSFRGKPLNVKSGSNEAAIALARVIQMTEKRSPTKTREQLAEIGRRMKANLIK
jgi:hypothetical protein